MHAKSGLRVVLKWKIFRPDSVIAAVIPLTHMSSANDFKTLATKLIRQCVSEIEVDESDIHQETFCGTFPTNPPPKITCVVRTTYRHPANVPRFNISKFQRLLAGQSSSGLKYETFNSDKYSFYFESKNTRHEIKILTTKS